MLDYLQKIGRSLMLPVSVLVVASLFMGLGYAMDPQAMSGSGNTFAIFMIQAGLVVINNLPILFALGIATGLAKDSNGAAALSGVVGYLMITTLLKPDTLALIRGVDVESIDSSFNNIQNVFIGIISGVTSGELYNRFHKTELPQWLAFFSGRRLVPILTAVASVVITIILYFLWPAVYGGLTAFGTFISGMGAFGAGLYGVFNKLLIPFGLHHALNNVFWFDTIGINDIGNFWGSTGTLGITGRYQAGFFPIMMFGLPAAGLAIYKNAKPENKKRVGALMLSGAIASFATGITEPLEFSFMFVAPGLYVVHAILTGVSMFVSALLEATAGFSFSAGLIDYVLSLRMPMANKPWMLLVVGAVMFVVYYLIFDLMIRKFDLETPGREKVDVNAEVTVSPSPSTGGNNQYDAIASAVYQAIGGNANINETNNCATRLRLTLEDTGKVNEQALKQIGVPGYRIVDKHNLQVIIGTGVQFVADALEEEMKRHPESDMGDSIE